MTTNEILTHFATLGGGALLMKALDLFVLPKKEKKDFDTKLRDELWDRINKLEGQLEEQNKMLMSVLQENARLLYENSELKRERENHGPTI